MARVSPRRSSSSSSTSSCSRARRSPPPAGRDSASPSVARSSRDTPGGSGPRTPPTAVRSSSVSCPAASPPRPGKSVAAARRVRYHHRFQMIPDVLHLGPIPIHIFGIFLALAFLAASAAASREFARKGYDPALGSSAVVWAAVGGIVGARLWLVLDAWPEFVRAPADFLWNGGGFVFYGGLAGGALAVTVFFRRAGIPWLRGADIVAPSIALGQAIGRLGCQLAGDGDWGRRRHFRGAWPIPMPSSAGTSRRAWSCIRRRSTRARRTSPCSSSSGAYDAWQRPRARSSGGTSSSPPRPASWSSSCA